MAVAIVVSVLAALAVGLLANRYVRPFATAEVQGIKLESMIAPVLTLAVILLAFVLVETFASFGRAKESAGEEARKVDFQFELAGNLPRPEAREMQGVTACYARVIAELEWPLTADEETAPEADAWTGRMRDGYARLARRGGEQPFALLLETERERGEARSARLTEARPALPAEVTILMIATTGLGVLALASFTLASVGRNTQIFAIAALAVILVVVQLTILDLDRPYSGVMEVQPTDIERIAEELAEDFEVTYPDAALPCDEQGREVGPA